jgi:hypothetical protein
MEGTDIDYLFTQTAKYKTVLSSHNTTDMPLKPTNTIIATTSKPQRTSCSDNIKTTIVDRQDSTDDLLLHMEYMSLTLDNLKSAVGGIREVKKLDTIEISALTKATVDLQTQVLNDFLV